MEEVALTWRYNYLVPGIYIALKHIISFGLLSLPLFL